MPQNTIIIAAIALLVGFVLGNVTAQRGPDIGVLEERLGERIDAAADAQAGLGEQLTEVSDQIAGLTGRFDGVDGGIAANGETLAGLADAVQSGIAGVEGCILDDRDGRRVGERDVGEVDG